LFKTKKRFSEENDQNAFKVGLMISAGKWTKFNQNEMSDFELKSDENAIKNELMISVGKWSECNPK
jgi:hypothetical protein